MEMNKFEYKNISLLIVALIALSFNSHFAQAAKKTQELVLPAKVYAYKLQGDVYVPVKPVNVGNVVVKKTKVLYDNKNVYIGAYIVNCSNKEIKKVKIIPSFVNAPKDVESIIANLTHIENNLKPKETRRFVIIRPINEIKSLLDMNISISNNCVLNAYEYEEEK